MAPALLEPPNKVRVQSLFGSSAAYQKIPEVQQQAVCGCVPDPLPPVQNVLEAHCAARTPVVQGGFPVHRTGKLTAALEPETPLAKVFRSAQQPLTEGVETRSQGDKPFKATGPTSLECLGSFA